MSRQQDREEAAIRARRARRARGVEGKGRAEIEAENAALAERERVSRIPEYDIPGPSDERRCRELGDAVQAVVDMVSAGHDAHDLLFGLRMLAEDGGSTPAKRMAREMRKLAERLDEVGGHEPTASVTIPHEMALELAIALRARGDEEMARRLSSWIDHAVRRGV